MEPARFAKCAGLVSASVGRMICIFWQWESLGRNAGANADLTDDPARIEWREFYELPGTAWSKRSREPTCTPEASGVPRRTVA